jgi:hypothetical protein
MLLSHCLSLLPSSLPLCPLLSLEMIADLRPSKILIDAFGRAKLCGFGWRQAPQDTISQFGPPGTTSAAAAAATAATLSPTPALPLSVGRSLSAAACAPAATHTGSAVQLPVSIGRVSAQGFPGAGPPGACKSRGAMSNGGAAGNRVGQGRFVSLAGAASALPELVPYMPPEMIQAPPRDSLMGGDGAGAVAVMHRSWSGSQYRNGGHNSTNRGVLSDAGAGSSEAASLSLIGSTSKGGGIARRRNSQLQLSRQQQLQRAQASAGVRDRADVYALGLIVWEMLAARAPFGHLPDARSVALAVQPGVLDAACG